MPKTLALVTGFPKINNDTAITNILLLALATAYVRGVTKDKTLNAMMFCSQFKTPSIQSKDSIR